jgi:hypothetical protein
MDPWTMSDHGPWWTGGTELAEAWPPAPPVCKDAGQGAGEGEWNTGNPMVHSPELGRKRLGRAMVVRAAVVGTLERSLLGLGEWEMGGRDGCGEEGRAARPFIGSEGGAGWPDGERDQAAGGGASMLVIRLDGEGKWGGGVSGE